MHQASIVQSTEVRSEAAGAHATVAALRERLGFEDRPTVPMFVRMPN